MDNDKFPDNVRVEYTRPNNNPSPNPNDIGQGAGTELKALLSIIGINSVPNCSCNARAKSMNLNGIDWCKNNKEEILSWMKEEADKRGLPFLKFGAKRILNYAISKAEKKGI